MKTYKLSKETGWGEIPADTETIVAHYRDGHTKRMTIPEFLVLGGSGRRNIVSIDCYTSGEKIPRHADVADKLQHITFTGVDSLTNLARLAQITDQYPLAEFGILASYTWAENGQRFLSPAAIKQVAHLPLSLNLSLHLCGKAAIDAAKGHWEEIDKLTGGSLDCFDRFQLNISTRKDTPKVCQTPPYDDQEVIIQQRNAEETQLFQETCEHWGCTHGHNYFSTLLDASGGHGIDTPISVLKGDYKVGYAGGINPDNVADKLSYLLLNGWVGDFWIDMESGVRTNDWLDLNKVERVLEICYNVLKGGCRK